MHVLVRFNLSGPSTWRLLGYGYIFHWRREKDVKGIVLNSVVLDSIDYHCMKSKKKTFSPMTSSICLCSSGAFQWVGD